MNSKCLLATLASDHADERVQVVLDRAADGASILSLVQQSWSESLGWYTQQAMNGMMTSRSLERIADHASNIATDVIFWIRGADVRHQLSMAMD